MANGFIVIDEKDWREATPEQRDWMIFKTLRSLDSRMQCLEKRPLMDKSFSFVGGALGGILAVLGMKWGRF
jgi:hypothetical protein